MSNFEYFKNHVLKSLINTLVESFRYLITPGPGVYSVEIASHLQDSIVHTV